MTIFTEIYVKVKLKNQMLLSCQPHFQISETVRGWWSTGQCRYILTLILTASPPVQSGTVVSFWSGKLGSQTLRTQTSPWDIIVIKYFLNKCLIELYRRLFPLLHTHKNYKAVKPYQVKMRTIWNEVGELSNAAALI